MAAYEGNGEPVVNQDIADRPKPNKQDAELRASLEKHRNNLTTLRSEIEVRDNELQRAQQQVETLKSSLKIKDEYAGCSFFFVSFFLSLAPLSLLGLL